MKKPYLILVRGIPGSGKSHVSQKLAEKIGLDDCVLLDPDATDYESSAYLEMTEGLRAEGVDEKFYPYRFLRMRAHQGIEDAKVIIWNQAFTNLDGFQKTIRNLTAHASDNNVDLPILVVEVEINPDEAKARISRRAEAGGHDVDDDSFQRFTNDYRSFEGEGFSLVKISGDKEDSTTEILAKLES